jgi:hypothetical protein
MEGNPPKWYAVVDLESMGPPYDQILLGSLRIENDSYSFVARSGRRRYLRVERPYRSP